MAKGIQKATGLNNVSETWDKNERTRGNANNTGNNEPVGGSDVPAASELDRLVKDEAAEYDNENKEDRLLGGDRATVNDAGADEEA